MLDDDVFLFDVLILDKLFLVEDAGVVHDLVIGSYGVRNDLTWVECIRWGTYCSDQYDNDNVDKLHGKISTGGVILHVSVAKKSSNKKRNNFKTPSFALVPPCPSDIVVTMRLKSDQNNKKFELMS
jgi:hypothetical protein